MCDCNGSDSPCVVMSLRTNIGKERLGQRRPIAICNIHDWKWLLPVNESWEVRHDWRV